MNRSLKRDLVPKVLLPVLAVAVVGEGVALVHAYAVMRGRGELSPTVQSPSQTLTDAADTGEADPAKARAPGPDWARPFMNLGSAPFADFDRMEKQMRAQMREQMREFGSAPSPGFAQAAQAQLAEEPERYVLTVHARDLANAQVHVDAQAHQLTLRIARDANTTRRDGQDDLQSTSRQSSVESFQLAHAVDSDHMKVKRDGNTLTVMLPKLAGRAGSVT